jgi:quinolinate synthetase A subunit/nicotinate-nucleotide pyrophosphorylase
VIGDSLQLAQAAARTSADAIVFCGVHFMAETAKILNPDKLVLLPDLAAGCSLADSCPAPAFERFVRSHPGHFVISYINCSAAVKTLSDVICTSSNAERIIRQVPPEQPIIFAPDQQLGRYLVRKTGREMLLWPGACSVHVIFSERAIVRLKTDHPDALVLAHPECEERVLRLADHIGSTTSILEYAKKSPAQSFIVVTESGIIHQMKKACPEKTFRPRGQRVRLQRVPLHEAEHPREGVPLHAGSEARNHAAGGPAAEGARTAPADARNERDIASLPGARMTADPFSRALSLLDGDVVRRESAGSSTIAGGRDVTVSSSPAARAAGAITRASPRVAGLDIARAVFGERRSASEPADGRQCEAAPRSSTARTRGTDPHRRASRAQPAQRLSGIATPDRYVGAVVERRIRVGHAKDDAQPPAVEKYAVRVGGGRNHRMGLYDAILIKDNHLAASGGLAPAIEAAKRGAGAAGPVQVEVESLEQLSHALAVGVDAVLLDNMPPEAVAAAVTAIRAHPRGAACWIEASGGITLENIRAYAEAGVDTVSVGALTHSAPAADIALDLDVSCDRS